MTPDAPPPYRHLTSTPLSLSTSSTLLSTYLLNSETHPHLHPDALITPAGVTFSSNGGPMGGVIMHNLRRVAAGLRGEFLEPERTPEPEEEEVRNIMGEETQGEKMKKDSTQQKKAVGESGGMAQEDWQDMSEFERQVEGTEGGEIAPEDTFVAAGGDVPEIHVDGSGKKRKKGAEEGGKKDKDAKKKAKKERQKAMRREKEMKRAKNED